MTIISQYRNGNTRVRIFEDGTKERESEGAPVISHPESIDVKITNYCDMGCAYCHESSTTIGKHGDLRVLQTKLAELPAGVELAIGGGNPLSHPELLSFLWWCQERGYICNLTVNQGHLYTYIGLLKYILTGGLIEGLGISITNRNLKYVRELKSISNNIVYHVIAGVNDVDTVQELIEIGNCKMLILGYKKFGFGVDYFSPAIAANIRRWYQQVTAFIGKTVISFDNLAIEQLNAKRLFTDSGWDKFYMGDDFTFTMYIDAVKQEFAPTSRSEERASFEDFGVIDYFQRFKK